MSCLCFGERRLRGRRRIFMNSWLLFSECVCPLSLSFLKQTHPMHSLYCKASLAFLCALCCLLHHTIKKQ